MKRITLFTICMFTMSMLHANDIDTLKNRVISDLMITANNTNISVVEQYINSIKSDGSFSDINYLSTAQTNWEPIIHLNRMRDMTYVYLVEGQSWFQNDTLLGKIESGMNYWYSVNSVSTNWWFNDIGKQKQLNIIGLLMEYHIAPSLLDLIVNDLSTQPSMTGANRTDISTSVIYRGMIEDSLNRINSGLSGIINEIIITTEEGIQPDFSFHQHGPFIYNRGYGYVFLSSTTYWCEKTVGTIFAYPWEKVELLSAMLLDGNRWMTHGKTMDYGTDGRGITRKVNSDGNALGCVTYLNHMANVDIKRERELLESAASISNGVSQNIIGNKYFWESDFSTHHRPDFYTSVHMCSQRTKGTESINDENLKGYWLPFGVNFIFRKGNEYHNIFPIWDWGRLPGVTSPYVVLQPSNYVSQSTSFVGGVSDSLYGISAMQMNKQSTMAKKAWFFFDNEWVALGSEINSVHSQEINTTLNQTFLDSTLILVNGNPVDKGIYEYDSLNWVYNNSIAYYFLTKKPVGLKAIEQSGSWYDINHTQSTDNITGEVFTLYLRHGIRPTLDDYAYIVAPGLSVGDAENYYNDIPISLIMNSSDMQAVKHKSLNITGIVFYTADSLNVDDTLKVIVDASCIVMVKKLEQEHYLVTISDPDENIEQINCTIFDGIKFCNTTFTMPGGINKGQSVTMLFDNFTITSFEKDNIIYQSQEFILEQNYPNPFNPSTKISYHIPKDDLVNLIIYNTLGQVVAELVNEHQISGKYSVRFNTTGLPSGVYFYKLESGGFAKVKKMLLLR